MPSFNYILLMVSENKIFEYLFENLPFILQRQPINLSDLDKSCMNCGGLLNLNISVKKFKYPSEQEIGCKEGLQYTPHNVKIKTL